MIANPVSWAMTMTARTAESSPPICSARIGSSVRSRSRRNSLRAPGSAAECSRSKSGVSTPSDASSSVHHEPGEVVGQVPPLAPEQVPHVEGVPDHLGEEPLLGAEVAVDRRGGHAGVRGRVSGPRRTRSPGWRSGGWPPQGWLPRRGGIPSPPRTCTHSTFRHVSASLVFFFPGVGRTGPSSATRGGLACCQNRVGASHSRMKMTARTGKIQGD